jgi:hypothetical protein
MKGSATLKCGDRIRIRHMNSTTNEHATITVWSLPQSNGEIKFTFEDTKVDISFAAAYDSYAMHTGILLKFPKRITHKLPYVKGGYRTEYSNLLIHMIERRNVVRVLFEMSNSVEAPLKHIGDVDLVNAPNFSRTCIRKLVPLGKISIQSEHLTQAAKLIETELEKPLFPLSKSNLDTSCLHLAMRLAHVFGCMPKWVWLKTKLPDAPVELSSRL